MERFDPLYRSVDSPVPCYYRSIPIYRSISLDFLQTLITVSSVILRQYHIYYRVRLESYSLWLSIAHCYSSLCECWVFSAPHCAQLEVFGSLHYREASPKWGQECQKLATLWRIYHQFSTFFLQPCYVVYIQISWNSACWTFSVNSSLLFNFFSRCKQDQDIWTWCLYWLRNKQMRNHLNFPHQLRYYSQVQIVIS